MKITCFCRLLLVSIVGLGCAQKMSAMTSDDLAEIARIRAWHEDLASRGLIRLESHQSVDHARRSTSRASSTCFAHRVPVCDGVANGRLMSPACFVSLATVLEKGIDLKKEAVRAKASLPTRNVCVQRMPGGYGGSLLVCCAAGADCYRECCDGDISGSWCAHVRALVPGGWLMYCCLCMNERDRSNLAPKPCDYDESRV